ncbi:putative hydrolase of the HAD superfamily [Paenibacillus phyllosphaerae]|uniref:Putative hydrolase of the HAD superfamily n=1 Tax=Paenibacillus phyllosphaerae TaxID=274593 RepID=A0A7W5B2N6_9BACL|nr:HAD family hydrolase [Paenibacillus phyllosphaerae]MBB3113228.1 putative hydrolase of the HAD superfamily [Paenibacillus phyllosphaerae]
MRFKAVLFDLDGTLLDRNTSLVRFVRDQYERYSPLQVVAKEDFVERFVALDNNGYVWKDNVYRQLIDEFSIPEVEWDELLDDYVTGFRKHCVGFPNLILMLTVLRNSGVRIALVSNGFGQFQSNNFESLGISHLFDAVLISEWEGLRKPDPAIFVRALSGLGVEAVEALFVGDHPENDIRASRAVGMKAAWKRNGGSSNAVEADLVIDDLEELIPYILGP